MCRVTEHLGLVHIIIRRYFPKTQYDYNDLFQEGCIGLVKADRRFNPELGFQFSTYAGKLIWGEIRRYLDKSNSSYSSVNYESFEDDTRLEETLSDGYNLEESVLVKLEVEDALVNLTQEERRILELRVIHEKLQKEIGELLGLDQRQVSKKLSKMTHQKKKERDAVRTQRVHKMFAKGCSNLEISLRLGLSQSTIRTYRSRWRKEVEYGGREAI